MPFGPIVIGSKTFNQAGVGLYTNGTTTFSSPQDIIKISGGKMNNTTKVVTAVVQRHLEKDITVGSDVIRRKLAVSLQVNVPQGFTTTEVDDLAAEISTFLTVDTINRILLGES